MGGKIYDGKQSFKLHGVDDILKKQRQQLVDEAVVYDRSFEKPKVAGKEIVDILEERGFLTDDFKG